MASKLHAHEQEAGNLASPLSPSASEGLAVLGTLGGTWGQPGPTGLRPPGRGRGGSGNIRKRGVKTRGKRK